MCTLLVASRVFDDTPLLVAANRDERLDWPAAPPRLFASSGIPVLAPVDLLAGGTWLGLSARGVFAGITNRFGVPPEAARRSRGELVFEALVGEDAQSGAERIAALDPSTYNAFHLFIADRAQLHVVWSDGQQMRRAALPPGFHALTERSFDAAPNRRAEHLLSWSRVLEGQGAAPSDLALRARLGFHDPTDPFAGSCVHLPPELPYGTRSSTLLRFGRAAHEVRMAHADGPPCKTPLVDQSSLVHALSSTMRREP